MHCRTHRDPSCLPSGVGFSHNYGTKTRTQPYCVSRTETKQKTKQKGNAGGWGGDGCRLLRFRLRRIVGHPVQ